RAERARVERRRTPPPERARAPREAGERDHGGAEVSEQRRIDVLEEARAGDDREQQGGGRERRVAHRGSHATPSGRTAACRDVGSGASPAQAPRLAHGVAARSAAGGGSSTQTSSPRSS